MVTKLKNMTNRKRTGLLLYLYISATTAVYSGAAMYNYIWSSAWTKESTDTVFIVSTMVFLILLGIYLNHYPISLWQDMKICKLDKVSPELILAALLCIAWFWYEIINSCIREGRFFFYWLSYRVTFYVLLTLFLFLPLSAAAYGTVTLLIRKLLRRDLKRASIVVRIIEKLKAGSDFEKQIRIHNDTSILLCSVCMLGIIAGCIKFASKNITWALLIFLFILALGSIFIYTFIKNPVYDDTGKLLNQIHAMSKGELDAPAIEDETSLLYNGSRELHSISKNLKEIMEKQMASERMKIDLITNVSHDLKTPLTSMVGYVDLLKKEPLNAEAKDYIEVLSLKQEQLKNIIQDIFELSKSTSGSIQLDLEQLDLKKLLDQTLADMDDKILKSGFIIRRNDTEEPLLLTGDGKKLYRVFQNLIDNALKYSLKGTRIFIETKKEANQIIVSLKNTSAYEMDFTSDEIMERFARGDKSRNTEGHGLGLAIAESFTNNMGGIFNIDIDGDQFKVTLCFAGN